jgi:hypothetical protein
MQTDNYDMQKMKLFGECMLLLSTGIRLAESNGQLNRKQLRDIVDTPGQVGSGEAAERPSNICTLQKKFSSEHPRGLPRARVQRSELFSPCVFADLAAHSLPKRASKLWKMLSSLQQLHPH